MMKKILIVALISALGLAEDVKQIQDSENTSSPLQATDTTNYQYPGLQQQQSSYQAQALQQQSYQNSVQQQSAYQLPSHEQQQTSYQISPQQQQTSYLTALQPQHQGYQPAQGFGVQTGYEGYLIPNNVNAGIYDPASVPQSEDSLGLSTLTSLFSGELGSLLSSPLALFTGFGKSLFPLLLPAKGIFIAVKALEFVFNSVVALIIGMAFTWTVCTFTPICTLSFHQLGPFTHTLHHEFRSYMTPENLANASKFFSRAIDKYQKMQRSAKTNAQITKNDEKTRR